MPVRFRGAIDHAGTRRPHPSAVTKTHPPWVRGWAPDGWRDVETTWREIMFAALMVGRDPTPWLVTQPGFAGFELLARVSPLAAYLRRARPTTGGYRLGPSPVYTSGAERSAQGAFAYRLGMTMAEWSARRLVDAAPTTHVESVAPPGAGLGWALPGRRPDLWAVDASRDLWMIEAKAARKLGRPQMREGAAQLAALAPPVLAAPHGRLLAGTSVDRELFVLLERDPPAPAPSPTGAARARCTDQARWSCDDTI